MKIKKKFDYAARTFF